MRRCSRSTVSVGRGSQLGYLCTLPSTAGPKPAARSRMRPADGRYHAAASPCNNCCLTTRQHVRGREPGYARHNRFTAPFWPVSRDRQHRLCRRLLFKRGGRPGTQGYGPQAYWHRHDGPQPVPDVLSRESRVACAQERTHRGHKTSSGRCGRTTTGAF